jgi:arylsulfatase A-like enzyme
MSDQPNVIVFFTDQQRWDASGLHGNPLELMPNFDRLASRGTHVPHSFTCQPVCGPARSCLQTGQYATNTGVWRNGFTLDPAARTLAREFASAGYRTGYIGKWHLGPREQHGPVAESERGGYQDWLASNVLEFTSNHYSTTLYDEDGNPVHLPGYRVDAVTDAAVRYVHRRSEEKHPFFLFLSYIEPHHQNHVDDYPPPVGYRERYAGHWTPPDLASLPSFNAGEGTAVGGSAQKHLGGYWGMIKRLDEALGRLQDALISLGLDDNTIVLFTSDHGCHFKTRNGEYKRSGHESSIRVPTALWGPGFEGGGAVPQLVSLVDLPPTLLDAAGITPPETMEGRPLRPLLQGADPDWPEEVFVQTSEAAVGRAVRTHRWKYIVEAEKEDHDGAGGAGRYTERFLYDLQHDPYELTNLIKSGAHAPVREVMQQRLRRRMRDAGEADPEIVEVETGGGGQRTVSEAEANQ